MAETMRRHGRSTPGIPVSAFAALPVCPACYPAYPGILSALGLTVLIDTALQMLLTCLFLTAALGALSRLGAIGGSS